MCRSCLITLHSLLTISSFSFLQDLVVTCPYADAIELHQRPIKVSCPKAKAPQAEGRGAAPGSESGFSRQLSAAESESSATSNESTTHSDLTKYIAQHYNPGALSNRCMPAVFARRQCMIGRRQGLFRALLNGQQSGTCLHFSPASLRAGMLCRCGTDT